MNCLYATYLQFYSLIQSTQSCGDAAAISCLQQRNITNLHGVAKFSGQIRYRWRHHSDNGIFEMTTQFRLKVVYQILKKQQSVKNNSVINNVM